MIRVFEPLKVNANGSTIFERVDCDAVPPNDSERADGIDVILVSKLCLAQVIGHDFGEPHTTCDQRICLS